MLYEEKLKKEKRKKIEKKKKKAIVTKKSCNVQSMVLTLRMRLSPKLSGHFS